MWQRIKQMSKQEAPDLRSVREEIEPPPKGTVAIYDRLWGHQARFVGLDGTAAGIVAGLGDAFDPAVVISSA